MSPIRIQKAASFRLDEIYQYSFSKWGASQAESYILSLFEAFEKIESHEVFSKPIPAELGVEGFYFRHQKHFIYWKYLEDGSVGIVTILHERMHQLERFRMDRELEDQES